MDKENVVDVYMYNEILFNFKNENFAIDKNMDEH